MREVLVVKHCEKCGNELFDEAVMCPKCGCSAGKSQTEKQRDEQAKNQIKSAIFILAGIAILVIFVLLVMAQL